MTAATSPIQKAPNQGSIERRDPVPAGRYWIYIDEKESSRWQAWVKAQQGKVAVIATEAQQSMATWLPAIFVTRWDLDIIKSTVGYWLLFDVKEPVPWVGLGLPTSVIDPHVHSSSEIMTAPAPKSEEELNPIGELYSTASTALKVAMWGAGAVVLFKLWQALTPASSPRARSYTPRRPALASGRS